jgi:hypothetical protein
MPDLSAIERALRAADAAGNVEDARRLAQAYAQAKAAQPDFSNTTGGSKSTEDDLNDPWRDIKMGGRSTMEGVAGIVDLLTSPLRAGAQMATGQRAGTMTDLASRGADKMGLPRPVNSQERVMSDIGRAVSGGAVTMGGGAAMAGLPGMAGHVGTTLSAQPLLQTLSGITGAASSGTVRENGGGQGAQIAAGIVGGLAPSGLIGTGQAAVRGALRGGEAGRKALGNSIDDFTRAGSTPTIGQGADNLRSRFSEAVLRNAPGSSGVVRNRLEQQAEEMGAGVERIAGKLSTAQGAERGGKAIIQGITGPSGFMSRFKTESSKLYDEVEKRLPPGTHVQPQATQRVLADLTTPIQGATNTSGLLMSPKVAQIAKAFGDDIAANGGSMPYEAMKRLRTQLGEMIGDSALSPDTPTRQLRKLYGSMSDDMAAAAVATGDPKAIQAAQRANAYYRAGSNRIDDIERVVDKNGGAEKVYQAFFANSKEGGTTIRKVMSSLDGQSQRDLAATTLRRLGKANPSAQNEVGDAFSAETYLTNWSRMAPEAKRALFDRFGPSFSKDLDSIAAATAKVRKANQTLPNPSGSAVVAGQTTAFGGLGYALLSGNPTTAGGIAAALTGTHLSARAMTSPGFVKWLARTTQLPAGAIPAQLSILANMAKTDEGAAEAYAALTANPTAKQQP